MEIVRFPSHGGFSVRSIIMFILAVVATALLWTTLTPTATHAADANWSGDSIVYDNHSYSEAFSISDTTGTIPSDATVYKTPIIDGGGTKKVFVIYFTSGIDPPTATSGTYVEFTYNETDGSLTKATNKQTVSLTEKSESEGSGSSCSVSGIGWIVCPVTTFLADGVDKIFSMLSSMLNARPLVLSDSSNSMYRAWDMARSIANVAFVIAFLIIIFSQLTSLGVTNYGIKKMIPRLIVAAVLVNVSFYIMAIAIDVSNILGYSVQNLFNVVQEQVVAITNDSLDSTLTSGWATVASVALAGGGAIAGSAYIAGGAIYLLIPLLVGLGLTVLLVLLILAARQAIIIVLVILAPLAFVANLLPNTEKWFTKWKDLFMTMLVFFPAFSLVFGGSQLAGQMIIQNAGDQLFMVIFGMAVQVAPLAITPLIMKFSGGILGKIAQIANNPNKGVIDRSRGWAEKRQKLAREKNIAQGPRLRNPTSWGSGLLRRSDTQRRKLDGNTAIWEQAATNRYGKSSDFAKINEHRARVDLDKQTIENNNNARIERLKAQRGTQLHESNIRAIVSGDSLEESQQRLARYHNTQRTTRGTALNRSMEDLEAQKAYTEASEQDKNSFLLKQRINRTTMLGTAAAKLETAKLNAQGWQDNYTTHFDELKASGADPRLRSAAIFAQSKKEHAEAAQVQVQAMFDKERKVEGSLLNTSTLSLEKSKLEAEIAKSGTTQYINNAKANVDGVLHLQHTQNEAMKLSAQESEVRLKSVVEEYKTGFVPDNAAPELAAAIAKLKSSHQATSIQTTRGNNAIKVQNEKLADALISDEGLRKTAGGINPQGADAALANAINVVRTAYGQSVTEARQIVKHFNLSSDQRQRLARGEEVTVVRDDGTSHTFTAEDTYAREAVIEDQIAVGTIPQVEELLVLSGKDSPLAEFRTTIADALAKNGLGGKSIYLGGKTIDDAGKGRFNGKEDLEAAVVEAIGNGKIAEKDLASIDPLAVKRFLGVAKRIKNGDIPEGVSPTALEHIDERLAQFSKIARKTLTGDESVNVKAAAASYIEQIGQLTDPTFKNPN